MSAIAVANEATDFLRELDKTLAKCAQSVSAAAVDRLFEAGMAPGFCHIVGITHCCPTNAVEVDTPRRNYLDRNPGKPLR